MPSGPTSSEAEHAFMADNAVHVYIYTPYKHIYTWLDIQITDVTWGAAPDGSWRWVSHLDMGSKALLG